MTDTTTVPGKHADGARHPEAFRQYRQGMAALALRLAGASYPEITEALGLGSIADAYEMVESTLAAQVNEEDREQLRQQEAARLDRLQRSIWGKATNENNPEQLPAINAVIKISESRRRLLGLDAPTEINVHTPTQDEIERWVARIAADNIAHLTALEAHVVELPPTPE
jgi:hypothetical protein